MLVVAASCGGGLPAPVDEALTTATPLRSYADPKHIRIGTTVSPDGFSNEELYKQILAHQFNIVVTEHMGMDVLQLQKGNWDFTKTDALLEYTAANQLDVWGPSLIYALDNPKWLDDGSWSPSDMDGIIHDHLQHVLDHVRGRIPGSMSSTRRSTTTARTRRTSTRTRTGATSATMSRSRSRTRARSIRT